MLFSIKEAPDILFIRSGRGSADRLLKEFGLTPIAREDKSYKLVEISHTRGYVFFRKVESENGRERYIRVKVSTIGPQPPSWPEAKEEILSFLKSLK